MDYLEALKVYEKKSVCLQLSTYVRSELEYDPNYYATLDKKPAFIFYFFFNYLFH